VAALARRHRRLALEWVAIVVPYAIVTAMYHMWWGGFSSPARFVGATLLIFAAPMAAAWASTTHAATRSVQAIALGVSAGIAVMLLAVERGEFVFNVRDMAAPWLVWASQMADLAGAVPSLFRLGPLDAFFEAALWSAAVASAWLVSRLAERVGRLRPGAAALAATCALGIAVAAATAAAWQIEGVSGLRATYGQLRALEAAGTLRGSHGVVLDSRAVMPPGAALERLRVGAEPAMGSAADVWLSLPFLPGGRYRLWADLSAAATFEVALVSGRVAGPIEAWTITGEGAGALSRELVLPVGLPDVRVRGDAGARPLVRSIWLQPISDDERRGPITTRRATSARQYGRLTVFAVGGVYLEPGGLWTAGGRTAELVVKVDPGESRAVFAIRGGPDATPVQVRAGAFSLDAELAPGEERELAIPVSPAGLALVTVRTKRGFRPGAVDPSSTDMRMLGVRLEPR
jgi:hypothetical protein